MHRPRAQDAREAVRTLPARSSTTLPAGYPISTLLGYMRISTKGQKFALQQDALQAAGVQEGYLYADMLSGSREDRPGLAACLKALQPGNTLVVWRLDRLARSLKHLMDIAAALSERGIALRILEGPFACMDPSTTEGKLLFSVCGAFAEFERNVIRERVIAGLEAARARGHHGGRRPKLSPKQQRQARMLAQS